MSLPIEYFTDQTHITDLEKLQYEKLYYIILSVYLETN